MQPVLSYVPEYMALAPRLSFRSPSPSEYPSAKSRQSTSTTGTALTTHTAATTSTGITSLSDCEGGLRLPGSMTSGFSAANPPAPNSPSARSSIASTTAQPAKSKKKPSFLGTLFAKEPSTDAFLQMQNQSRKQAAQTPGRKNPPGMSGVSSAKMPEHVPKVNSKWDGMPCKTPEDGSRAGPPSDSRRTSKRISSIRAHSAGPGDRSSHGGQLSEFTTNSKSIDQKRSEKSSHLNEKRSVPRRFESVAESTSSSNSIKHPRPKSMSIRTQSLRSPSGSSLPQITSFFPNDIPDPPGVHQIYRGHPLSHDSGRVLAESRVEGDVPESAELRLELRSDNASSCSVTPLEQSPTTPWSELISVEHIESPIANLDDSISFSAAELKPNEGVFQSPDPDELRLPETNGKISRESARAFLAGEAHPLQLPNKEQGIPKKNDGVEVFAPAVHVQDLERRPDSSRARLGLRASMIKSADAAPWEGDKETDPRLKALDGDSSPRHRFSKSFGVFGKA